MIEIKDLKRSPDIFNLPSKYIESLPEDCAECGSPMGLTEGLLKVECTNKNCITHIGKRLEKFFRQTGYRVELSQCIEVIKRYGWSTPLEIFNHPDEAPIYPDISNTRQHQIMQTVKGYENAPVWQIYALSGRVSQEYAYRTYRTCLTIDEARGVTQGLLKKQSTIAELRELMGAREAEEDMKVLKDGKAQT